MGGFDFRSIIELLKLVSMPVNRTMSILFGRKVVVSDPVMQSVSIEELRTMLPCPCVAIGMEMTREQYKSRQILFVEEEIAGCAADLVMGNEGRTQKIDSIVLSTIQEIAAQGIETAGDALTELLGYEVQEELNQVKYMVSEEEPEVWCRQGKMQEFFLVQWKIEIQDIGTGRIYGILPDVSLQIMGAGSGKDESIQKVRCQEVNAASRQGRRVKLKEAGFPEFKATKIEHMVNDIDESREVIQEIPLEVSVEIGSVKCTVQDILNLEEGRILMLDKQAGSPADVVVNGELIGKGDVMVMGDQFAARIIEIVNGRGKI